MYSKQSTETNSDGVGSKLQVTWSWNDDMIDRRKEEEMEQRWLMIQTNLKS